MNHLTEYWLKSKIPSGHPIEDLIMAKVIVDHRGCWLYGGARIRQGYGRINWRGRAKLAHRLMYEALIGPIPEGLTLDHLCRVRECVNPAHMEPVTLRDNILRGSSPAAKHARKTHCVRGHAFTPDNTYLSKANKRQCRTCMRARGSLRRPAH